jgi:hypothetical protein
VDPNRAAESLGRYIADNLRYGHVLSGREDAVSDQDLPWARIRTQAGSKIRDAPDGGVVETTLEADSAKGRKARSYADAES